MGAKTDSGGGVLAKLLEATHCLSRNCLLCSFLLLDNCVNLPPFICHNCRSTFQLPLSAFLTVSIFCVLFLVFTHIKIRRFDWSAITCCQAMVTNGEQYSLFKEGQWTLQNVFFFFFSNGTATMFYSRWSMFRFISVGVFYFYEPDVGLYIKKKTKNKSAFQFLGRAFISSPLAEEL